MSVAVSGDAEKIDIDGTLYAITSDTDFSRALGGYGNEVMSNGDGSSRLKKTRKKWAVTGMSVSCDDAGDNQHQKLQDVADKRDFVQITLYMADGSKWSGRGQIEGDLVFSPQNVAATFDLGGEKRLTRQGA